MLRWFSTLLCMMLVSRSAVSMMIAGKFNYLPTFDLVGNYTYTLSSTVPQHTADDWLGLAVDQ